ncbi:MAG: DUF3039 domain-containing protein [Egibacteraceae bacterium]
MSIDTTTKPVPVDTDHGDHERFAHWARKSEVTKSYVTGQPITALCGKRWVPTRDPSRYPVCPECKEIYTLRGAL